MDQITKGLGIRHLTNPIIAVDQRFGPQAFYLVLDGERITLAVESWHVDYDVITCVDVIGANDTWRNNLDDPPRMGSRVLPIIEALLDEYRGEMAEAIEDPDADTQDLTQSMTQHLRQLVSEAVQP